MPAVRLSRYEFAPVEEDDHGRTYLDVPDPLPRRVRSDDLRFVVGDSDNLWSVAWRAYEALLDREQDIGPSRFFWVIGEINDIVDGRAPIPAGTVLRIPSIRSLTEEILVPPRFFTASRAGEV